MEEVRGGAPTRKGGGGDRFVAISRAPEVIILTLTLYFLRACLVDIIMPVCSFSISESLISFQANNFAISERI
jgi:hypothetical protein